MHHSPEVNGFGVIVTPEWSEDHSIFAVNFSTIYCHFHCFSQDESDHAIGQRFQYDYTRREGLRKSNMEGEIQLWREGFNR